MYSDQGELLSRTEQGYWYYIFFLEESIDLNDIGLQRFKDDVLAAFKTYKTLQKKQFSYQLKILSIDGKEELFRGLMIMSKKMLSIMKLLLLSHLSKTKRQWKSKILFWD